MDRFLFKVNEKVVRGTLAMTVISFSFTLVRLLMAELIM